MSRFGMAKNEADILADLRAALREGASTRSPLFQWMLRHHDKLADAFAESRPKWAEVAALLAGKGFTSTEGKPLNPQSVRQMWYRVRRRHAATRAGTKAPRQRPRAEEPPAGVAGAGASAGTPAPAEGRSATDLLADLRKEINERSGRKA